jgi:DeoR/GlpR family transcriptional regulator of sugar metabolism
MEQREIRGGTDRPRQILEMVRERGFVRTTELSNILGVSTVTIRQDVESLQDQGLVRKTYGGAASITITSGTLESAFAARSVLHREEKQRIGVAAAAMISSGETILLDTGTTAIEIARNLPENRGITVVTCALNVAIEAGSKPGIRVILCGGQFNPQTLSVTGHQVEQVLEEVNADRLFLATYGIDLRKGLTERNIAGAQVKRALIQAAKEVVLTCDSSKFETSAAVITAPLSSVHTVVTDSGIAPSFAARFRKMNIPVLIA